MSAPWLKFFPSDWRADPSLRMCSIAARGLWIEMLCVMHEATPRGTLRVNGKPVSDKQMAILAGCSNITGLLQELEEAGVFSREPDGTIFSRRMMRDVEKAEQDKANGRKGGNPTLKAGVNPQLNGDDKAQKPEARSQSSLRSEDARETDFDQFWEVYPNKVGEPAARKAFSRAASRATVAEIIRGASEYAAKTDDRQWCNPATWLSEDRWKDQPAKPPDKPLAPKPGTNGLSHLQKFQSREEYLAAEKARAERSFR
ncbi:hypothetical protein [Rhizobium ruizarguesonis]|uniref:hypothetical protein n=1 Tax=Rhizobium ruizarguesonis TaxID=2081791 RepID=UPI001FE01330|nr:hypothetical protein [Rhizobium ruizarguesonis]